MAGIKLDKSFTDTIDDAGGPEWRLARALSEMAILLAWRPLQQASRIPSRTKVGVDRSWLGLRPGLAHGHAAPAEEIAVGISVAEHTAGPAGATADESANLSH